MNPRVLILALFAYQAIPGRFFTLYLQAHGLSPAQIGFILSLSTILTILTAPYLAEQADRCPSRPRFISRLVLVSILLTFLHLLAFPPLRLLPPALRFPFMLVVTPVICIFQDEVAPLVTALTIAVLRLAHGAHGHLKYARERMWGSVSRGLMSLILGFLLDRTSLGIALVYPLRVLFALLFILVLARFEDSTTTFAVDETQCLVQPVHQQSQNTPPSFRVALRAIVHSSGLRGLAFLHLTFWLSMAMNGMQTMVFLYLVNYLHASTFLCSVSIGLSTVIQVPVFASMPYLLRRVGEFGTLAVAGIAFSTRAMGCAWVSSAWGVVVLEIFQAIAFAAGRSASVAFVGNRTPEGMEGSGIAAMSVVRRTGMMMGEMGGGLLMTYVGAKTMFAIFGMAVLGACVVLIGVEFWMWCNGRIEEAKKTGGESTTER